MLLQRLPSDNSRMLAQLETAILSHNHATVHSILEQLDLMSANECLRQLGEAWGFPTVEIRGQRIMAMRDLAQLVYGYDNTANINNMLRRFNRSPVYLQGYNTRHKVQIRRALGIRTHATSVSLATWADLLIIGMRGHIDGAKRLQAYLLKAERENRIHWTMEQLRKGDMLSKVVTMLYDRDLQINWAKRRNERIIAEGGMNRFYRTWHEDFIAYTGQGGQAWERQGKAEGMKFTKKRGQRQSALQVVRQKMPEAGAAIGMESELYARSNATDRDVLLRKLRALGVQYMLPYAREVKALGFVAGEEAEFWQAVEEGL